MLSTDLNESATDTNESNVKQLVESNDYGSNNVENSTHENTGNEAVVNRDELINEASNLLNEGKQFLLGKDYTTAANTLLMACCKYCEIYGDFSDECGDAYFYYGCALLELELIDNKSPRTYIKGNVSKNHINTCTEVNDEEAKGDNVSENLFSDETLTRSSEDGKVEPGNESSRKEEISNINKDSEKNTMNPVDIDESHLVQEILELAKDIFTRQNNVEKLINIYSKLGKAYMISGDYSRAITNTEQCLKLQEQQTKPAEKEIVDTVIQLGTACVLSGQYYTAVRHFTFAGIILEKYIRYLLRTLDSYEGEDDVNTDNILSEVNEAKSLLKSIKDKICDAEDQIRATVNSNDESKNNGVTKKGTDNDSKALSDFSSETRINIVSNFLRRKRKLIINDSDEIKRPRLETSV